MNKRVTNKERIKQNEKGRDKFRKNHATRGAGQNWKEYDKTSKNGTKQERSRRDDKKEPDASARKKHSDKDMQKPERARPSTK